MRVAGIQAQLAELRERLHRGAAMAAKEAAEAACADAKARVPVETGRLRASLAVRAEGETARVVADCPYAAAVELGSTGHPARPFLKPAADGQRGAFAERARRAAKG